MNAENKPPETPEPPPLPPPPDQEPDKAASFTGAEPMQSTFSQEAVVDRPLDLSQSQLAAQAASAALEPIQEEEEAPSAPVDLEALGRTVEALLFASETPLTAREVARASGARTADVRKALTMLRERIEAQGRSYELVDVASGHRLVTRAEFFPAIQKLKNQRAQRKLTPAALETLALIAYSKEPVGRSEIEAVRGVDAGPVLRQLLERKLIKIEGRGQGLGQPLLYGISSEFLEHFGLKSNLDLPRPGELKSS